jgi:hypothetical protein
MRKGTVLTHVMQYPSIPWGIHENLIQFKEAGLWGDGRIQDIPERKQE